jgi:EAL domain-containing protein (putative c-di-GMP-specific phosphodiesterase class I)
MSRYNAFRSPFPEFSSTTQLLCACEAGSLLLKARAVFSASSLKLHEWAGCLLADSGDRSRAVLEELGRVLSPAERSALKIAALPAPATDLTSVIQGAIQAKSLAEWEKLLSNDWVGSLISDDRLISYFQPLFWSNSRDLFGYEALLRGNWEGEIVTAKRIFDAAADANALFMVDQSARSSAIHCAVKAGLAQEMLLINFLPSVIYDPSVCLETTLAAMQETGLKSNQIIFEVVETEKIEDPRFLKTVLQAYRDMGFGVALDDLGAGHSSLQLLTDLHPDYAKLDMQFVRSARENRLADRMMDSICRATQSEGIRIVAEGIEREEDYLYCLDKGVDLIQGYYFGRPSPILLSSPS